MCPFGERRPQPDAGANLELLFCFELKLLQGRENTEHRILLFVSRDAHLDTVVGLVIADLHVDGLRAAVIRPDQVLINVFVNEFRLRVPLDLQARSAEG